MKWVFSLCFLSPQGWLWHQPSGTGNTGGQAHMALRKSQDSHLAAISLMLDLYSSWSCRIVNHRLGQLSCGIATIFLSSHTHAFISLSLLPRFKVATWGQTALCRSWHSNIHRSVSNFCLSLMPENTVLCRKSPWSPQYGIPLIAITSSGASAGPQVQCTLHNYMLLMDHTTTLFPSLQSLHQSRSMCRDQLHTWKDLHL